MRVYLAALLALMAGCFFACGGGIDAPQDAPAMTEADKTLRVDELKAQIARLEEKKAGANMGRLFRVESSALEFGDFGPAMKITATNNAKEAVASVSMRAKLTSPGRSIPWKDERFQHDIEGGLEPGETKTWNLTPFWQLDRNNDYVLEIETVDVRGGDGKTLTEAVLWTDADQQQLDAAIKELANLER